MVAWLKVGCDETPQGSNWSSGGIVTNNWRGTVYGIQRKWMRQIDPAADEGDSGSGWKPFTYTHRDLATGIASFADGSTALATHMYDVETKLGVTTCGTSGIY